jgi:hypothetical protein
MADADLVECIRRYVCAKGEVVAHNLEKNREDDTKLAEHDAWPANLRKATHDLYGIKQMLDTARYRSGSPWPASATSTLAAGWRHDDRDDLSLRYVLEGIVDARMLAEDGWMLCAMYRPG